MTKVTSEKFLDCVAKSGLIEQANVDRLMEKVRAKLGGQLPQDPRKLGTLFKKQGLLTQWHLDKLLHGKYKGFFLGKYKLLGHIGTGGMSSVYLAEHMALNDKRAIKVLPKKRNDDATYLARFQNEAKAIASLNHPNIVLAYDIDEENGVHYIVMEYVEGVDLLVLVKRDGPLDFSTTADLIAQAARGLEHAHSKNVIHRDVKPANLLLDPKGKIRLLDMGLALVTSGDEESLTVANNENVLGTADYLAPEQALNSHTVDHRADVYGLGCTMYFLLTGRPPFNDGTLAQRIAKHQTEMPPPIRSIRPDCPGELEGVCIKMIQKDPKYRYQSAGDVAEVLEHFAARVPKGVKKLVVGLGEVPEYEDHGSSSLSFDDSTIQPGNDQSQIDTISNEGSQTISKSRAELLRSEGISSSDSGRLVDVRPRADILDGSFIDLQVESGYRPNSGLGRVDTQQDHDRPPSFPEASSTSRSSVNLGADSDVYGSSRSRSGRSRRGRDQGIDPMLIGALGLALFIVAIALGFWLARATAPSETLMIYYFWK